MSCMLRSFKLLCNGICFRVSLNVDMMAIGFLALFIAVLVTTNSVICMKVISCCGWSALGRITFIFIWKYKD